MTPAIASNGNSIMVVLTTGKQDRGTRATLAFSWACAGLALGKNVAVYLTMDGTIWAIQNSEQGVEVGGFEPLANYLEQFFALGGELLVCAPCSEFYCSFDRAAMRGKLRSEATLVGLATVVARTGPETTTVTF
ncbi:MAG: DsrE family protein [Kiritimatiellaeota bacterium]|nr:DsrE family protein [Kiritimatiellota bacterium]